MLRSKGGPVFLSLVVAVTLVPGVGGRAQTTTPQIVTDSLAALNGLVSKDNCALKDAADGDAANGTDLPFILCDDGPPPSGGGSKGIPVPAAYHPTGEDDFTGLPAPATPEETAAADDADDLQPEEGDRITLDVDVTLPPTPGAVAALGATVTPVSPPKGGFPVIVFMHGCCGGNRKSWEADSVDAANESWHHSNAWFAARGYIVINYTARGFRDGNDQGSTGSTQLDARQYEINDYQYLTGLLADADAAKRASGEQPLFGINRKKIGAVGGSYGGGFAWLALTDPSWKSPASTLGMRLGAVVTKYGWTDLVEALVPGGHYLDRDPQTSKTVVASTDPAKAVSLNPIGVEKQSIVSGLYASGNLANGNHTTFPQYMHEAFARLQQGEPYEGDPTVESIAKRFIEERSAYFQQAFWTRVQNGLRVPLFAAATWTDPLFPTMETVRFYNKLKKVAPDYPVQMYLGDYQHFTQNKPKEWDDLCGSDHHVCAVADYKVEGKPLKLNKAPNRVRMGINSRINKFLDHFLKGIGKPPPFNVSATTTICPANATASLPVEEPGLEYRAKDWRSLQPNWKVFGWSGGGTIISTAVDGHAAESDPVARDRSSEKCYTTDQTNPGPGVVQFVSDPLGEPFTMLGVPVFTFEHSTTATNYWVEARLFDQAPDGAMTLVTRGPCRVDTEAAPDIKCSSFALFGNAWIFGKDHRVVVELTMADTPFLRRSNVPATASVDSANIRIPTTSDGLLVDFRSQ